MEFHGSFSQKALMALPASHKRRSTDLFHHLWSCHEPQISGSFCERIERFHRWVNGIPLHLKSFILKIVTLRHKGIYGARQLRKALLLLHESCFVVDHRPAVLCPYKRNHKGFTAKVVVPAFIRAYSQQYHPPFPVLGLYDIGMSGNGNRV